MEFTVEQQENLVIIKPEIEEIIACNYKQLPSFCEEIITNGVKNIVLNLGKVNFIDSSGLSALLIVNRLCKDAKGSLVICNLHPNIQKLIGISQLQTVLEILPSLEEATDFIKMEELTRQIMGFEEE